MMFLQQRLNQILMQAELDVANRSVARAKELAPQRTGALRDSIMVFDTMRPVRWGTRLSYGYVAESAIRQAAGLQ